MTEDDNGPTDLGAKVAWKEKLFPAATLMGRTGRPLSRKFGLPASAIAVTTRAVLAWHCTVRGGEVELRLIVPKLSDVQFMGRLTGDPYAYRRPCVVP